MTRPLLLSALALLSLSSARAEDALVEAAAPAPSEAPRYRFDTEQSQLFIEVFKDRDTVGAALSHDHAIAANGWSGEARWDPQDLSACQVSFSLPVAELDPDPPALRAQVGLPGELPPGLREEVKHNMLKEEQLWAERHPHIAFSSTACEPQGDRVAVRGQLSIRGVTKPVTALMKVDADGQSFAATGRFEIQATQFGFEPYSAALGAFKNLDDMRIVVKVVGAGS